MLSTTHYGLNIVEGTDVVNPLVQQNPNYTAIDAAMFANKQGSIGSGTELTAGTVHTITRANPDSNYVRFTATSNWTAGDSMVIDATPVSVYLSDGTVPGTGAYLINTEVFLIVSGSRVTLLTSAGRQNAAGVSYNNASSGLNANNVQAAIDEVADPTVETLTLSDVMTIASGVLVASSTVKKKGNKIFVSLVGSGDITFGTNGNVQIATINSAYRPFIRQTRGVAINVSSSGQIYGPAVCNIYETGVVTISYKPNETVGSASYAWSGAAGCNISWDI